MTTPRAFVYPLHPAALFAKGAMCDAITLTDLTEIDDLLRGCIDLRVPFAVLPCPINATRPAYSVYVPDPLPSRVTYSQLWSFVRAGISERAEAARKDRDTMIALEHTHEHTHTLQGDSAHA
jgi:hypothetical protein